MLTSIRCVYHKGFIVEPEARPLHCPPAILRRSAVPITTRANDPGTRRASIGRSLQFIPNEDIDRFGYHPDSGLLVLSSSRQIVHIDAQARKLLALFGQAYEHSPCLSLESMPSIITEFSEKVFTELRIRHNCHNWPEADVRQVCHMVKPPLLLRGFGMPPAEGQEPRMVLVLQPRSPLDGSFA